MWTYSTNIMGPTKQWYQYNKLPCTERTFYSETLHRDITITEYDIHYVGGRIDCYCNDIDDPDYNHYNQELSLPIMEEESFNIFDKWVENYVSERLDFDILQTFEIATGYTIKYFNQKI